MPFSATSTVGVDTDNTILATDIAAGRAFVPFKLGQQTWGDNGRLYVFGRANASIPASTAVCTVNPSTFLVTASGGSYTSPAFAMVSGDFGWFSKASV